VDEALEWFTWLLFGYVVLQSNFQVAISIATYSILRRDMLLRRVMPEAFLLSGLEPPISIVIAAFNEEHTVITSVRALLQLRYAVYEIIVVNDGSTDATLQRLAEAFDLEPFPQAWEVRLATEKVRGVYHSPSRPMLRVIDKENGGKADAINCGINAARYPLFCSVDADSLLERDSLLRVVQPFIEDQRTVACGGTVRLANGCEFHDGNLVRAGLPQSWMARFQIVEYLRGFLFGRMGWSRSNGLLIIPGAFGLLHKETVIEVGGYRRDTVGEDMELVVRIHRVMHERGQPYRISFVADPICWTQAPEDRQTLRHQRIRWQRGLSESLWLNRGLLLSWPPNVAGWFAYPYFLVFEWAAPIIEFLGYVLVTYLLYSHDVGKHPAMLFLAVAVGFGVLLSSVALLLEELSFHVYPRRRDMFILFGFSVLENFGYRQLNVLWRLRGTFQWLRGKRGGWGDMQRKSLEGREVA
jgi:cellulose synthase/poly-beta-1,6-N-acetylglucosamine synthase-like glycosyltransferase